MAAVAARILAPARRLARAGACALLLAVPPACDRVGLQGGDDGPRVIELAHDTIHLDAGQRLHQVSARRRDDGDFDPAAVTAHPGDYVRFTAGDRAGHAISFAGHELAPAVREFLERTGQLRSPPLVDADAAWVITLDDAPPGEYPFHCTTHNAVGRLTVSPR